MAKKINTEKEEPLEKTRKWIQNSAALPTIGTDLEDAWNKIKPTSVQIKTLTQLVIRCYQS